MKRSLKRITYIRGDIPCSWFACTRLALCFLAQGRAKRSIVSSIYKLGIAKVAAPSWYPRNSTVSLFDLCCHGKVVICRSKNKKNGHGAGHLQSCANKTRRGSVYLYTTTSGPHLDPFFTQRWPRPSTWTDKLEFQGTLKYIYLDENQAESVDL